MVRNLGRLLVRLESGCIVGKRTTQWLLRCDQDLAPPRWIECGGRLYTRLTSACLPQRSSASQPLPGSAGAAGGAAGDSVCRCGAAGGDRGVGRGG